MKSLGYSFCLSSPTVKRPRSPPARKVDPPKAAPTPVPLTKPQPEPTSNIREIIKQFNNRPPPESKAFEPVRSVSTLLPVRSIHASPSLNKVSSDLISCWILLGAWTTPVILHHQCLMDPWMHTRVSLSSPVSQWALKEITLSTIRRLQLHLIWRVYAICLYTHKQWASQFAVFTSSQTSCTTFCKEDWPQKGSSGQTQRQITSATK